MRTVEICVEGVHLHTTRFNFNFYFYNLQMINYRYVYRYIPTFLPCQPSIYKVVLGVHIGFNIVNQETR